MTEIIALLMQYLPSQVKAIKLLQYAPDAIATGKELVEFVQRTIATLKKKEMLSPEEEAKLDALIAKMSEDPYWEPDPTIDPPKKGK